MATISTATTLNYLANLLLTAQPATQPKLNRVFVNPPEALPQTDLPFAVVVYQQGENVRHRWRQFAYGTALFDYQVDVYFALGERTTEEDELASRLPDWAQALGNVLQTDITLGGNCCYIGPQDQEDIFDIEAMGAFSWGGVNFFGFKVSIEITEQYIPQAPVNLPTSPWTIDNTIAIPIKWN